ncbi:MAG: hypothetical protein J0L82_00365 [Deltaproteobacteria bacterium]|nr:hypothetical protein [Deltaproteobacteria bacterium]
MGKQNMFWGITLATVGVLILVQSIFKIDLPIFRILIGVGIVYLGVKMVFGSFGLEIRGAKLEKVATATSVIFTEADLRSKSDDKVNRDYQTVFGNSKLDLSVLTNEDLGEKFEVSAVFGKTEVLTPKDLPLVVHTNTAFGSVNVRGDKTTSIGNGIYRTPGFDSSKPHVKIEANSVFGEVEIR